MADDSTSLSLLERMRSQNPDAWKRMVFLYSPLVCYWFHSWGVHAAEVEDLRQEVFQAVAAGLESFQHGRPGDSFRGWLRVIAHRKFLDHCRRRAAQPFAQGGWDAHQKMLMVPERNTLDDDPSAEVKALYHRALEIICDQFEDHTWQAFWRCAVEGQTPNDVARDLNMTAAAVRQAKSRVLRRLKQELGKFLS